MKKIYFQLLLTFISINYGLTLQAQCTGTPTGFTLTPLSQTVCAGQQATFVVTSGSSTVGITYQWHQSTISIVGPYSPINGATANEYISGPINTTTWFNVVIKCANSQQTINLTAAVTVSNCGQPCAGQPATTSIVPQSATICAGDVSSLSLTTTYTDTGITFQWGASSSAFGFTAIPNATLSSYTTGTLLSTTYYNVTVTCANSSLSTVATSTISVVSCTSCSGLPAPNTVSPINHTICMGSATSMTVTNSYTASGITYQWQTATISAVGPFSPISGATLTSYSTPVLNQTTYYNVVITCTNSGKSISVSHAVTVVSCTTPCSGTPASTSVEPTSQTLCVGDAATMNLSTFYPYTGLTYQWSSSTVQTGPYMAIPGATLNNYTSSSLFANTFYSVVVTCTNSQASTSATHSVAVVNCTYCAGTPMNDTILPDRLILCTKTTYTLSLSNTYTTSGMTFQWQSSTTSSTGPFTDISGAIQSSLQIATPLSGGYIHYQVVITCLNSGKSITVVRTYQKFICDGIDEFNFTAAKIYPNPMTNDITIQVISGPIQLAMTDLFGRVVTERQSDESSMRLTLIELPPGIYFARIKHQGREEIVKVIKQ